MTSIATSPTDGGALYEELRPLMMSISYRMLGSVAEAEDVVQEAFIRLAQAIADGTRIESPKAYLATVTTRLAIDQLRSARVRREAYVGPWLPEPLVTDTEPDVAELAEMSDSLSMAFLVLLESLSPTERAVFLLREVFGYEYAEIAEIVEKSEANCRQIFVRARRAIDAGKPRFESSREQRDELGRRFVAAIEQGDLDGLVELLAADAVWHADGGGKTKAASRPVYGRDHIRKLLRNIFAQGYRVGASVRAVEVNGAPGAMTLDAEGRIVSVLVAEVADGAVQAVRSVVNPDKLGHLGETSPLALRPPPVR
ncbi:MAG TPA: RNA polymerase sigma-70 factor [Thermoleophilaceae bacterium]